jgi:hypothetical protein
VGVYYERYKRRLGLPYSQPDATLAGIACLILLEVMFPVSSLN